jgi:hypothetical protein
MNDSVNLTPPVFHDFTLVSKPDFSKSNETKVKTSHDYQTWDIPFVVSKVKQMMKQAKLTEFLDTHGYMIDYADRTFKVKLEDKDIVYQYKHGNLNTKLLHTNTLSTVA